MPSVKQGVFLIMAVYYLSSFFQEVMRASRTLNKLQEEFHLQMAKLKESSLYKLRQIMYVLFLFLSFEELLEGIHDDDANDIDDNDSNVFDDE